MTVGPKPARGPDPSPPAGLGCNLPRQAPPGHRKGQWPIMAGECAWLRVGASLQPHFACSPTQPHLGSSCHRDRHYRVEPGVAAWNTDDIMNSSSTAE
jgi:hypothetical protein